MKEQMKAAPFVGAIARKLVVGRRVAKFSGSASY